MTGSKRTGIGTWALGIATVALLLMLVLQLRGRPDEGSPLDFAALRDAASAERSHTEWTLYAAPRCDECAEVWRLFDEARRLGVPGVGSGFLISFDGSPDAWREAVAAECAQVEGLRSPFLAVLARVGLQDSLDPAQLAKTVGVGNLPDYEDCLAGERLLFEVEAATDTASELAPTASVILHGRSAGSSAVLTGQEVSDSLAALLARAGGEY